MSQFRRPLYPPELVKVPRLALILGSGAFLGLLFFAFVCFFNEARAQTTPPPLSQGTGPQSGAGLVNAHNGVVNAFDYPGVLCNGVNDDTAGINAAATAAGVGGTVWLNQPYTGNPCMISNSLVPLNYQHWYGPGIGPVSVKVLGTWAHANTPAFKMSNAVGVEIDGINIDGNESTVGYSGLACFYFSGGSSNVLRNVHPHNCDYGMQTASGAAYITVENSSMNQNNVVGLDISAADYITVRGITYGTDNCNGPGNKGNIVIEGGSYDVTIDSAIFDEATYTGTAPCPTLNIQDAKRVDVRNAELYTGEASYGILIGDGTNLDTDQIHIYDSQVRPWNVGPVANMINIVSGTNIFLTNVQTTGVMFTGSAPDGGDYIIPFDGGVNILDATGQAVLINVDGMTKNTPGLNPMGGIVTQQLPTPAAPTVVCTAATGSLLKNHSYCYTVAAKDLIGSTAQSIETCVTTANVGSNNYGCKVTAKTVWGAQAYIFGGNATGAEQQGGTVNSGISGNAGPVAGTGSSGIEFVDNGSVTFTGAMPTTNTTGGYSANSAFICSTAPASGECFVAPSSGYYCLNGTVCTVFIRFDGTNIVLGGVNTNMQGAVASYDGKTTAGIGVQPILAANSVTSTTAAFTTYTPSNAGMFEIGGSIIATAGTNASSITVTYTDCGGATHTTEALPGFTSAAPTTLASTLSASGTLNYITHEICSGASAINLNSTLGASDTATFRGYIAGVQGP